MRINIKIIFACPELETIVPFYILYNYSCEYGIHNTGKCNNSL